MTWRLRKVLPKYFALSFRDADSALNHRLLEYESLQFLNPQQDQLVAIAKTEEQGDLYDTVLYGDQRVSYPQPFVFTVAPSGDHPNHRHVGAASRAICVYDNAGESFEPSADTATNPVTRHLALSRALMFLFDPTQDFRFRRLCSGKTHDPQMLERSERLPREHAVRQETILSEAAQRVRRFSGLGENQKHSRPVIVVVTKFDTWFPLLKLQEFRIHSPWAMTAQGAIAAMRLDLIEGLSERLRSLLWQVSPEIVSIAEAFASRVLYVPVSATGCSPEGDGFGFRPCDIKPVWAEVPLLYAMSRWMEGLVPFHQKSSPNGRSSSSNGRS
jgi:hypothetical protein